MSDRPVPVPDQDSARYWEAAGRHELLIQFCEACNRYQFYPRSICLGCGSADVSWKQASGRGTIYSFTVNHRPAGPWAVDLVPYVVALIDLEEGPRVLANIVDSESKSIEIGARVTVQFEDVAEGIALPQFTPEAAGPSVAANNEEP